MNVCSFSPDGNALRFYYQRSNFEESVPVGRVWSRISSVTSITTEAAASGAGRAHHVRPSGHALACTANGEYAEQLTTLDAAQRASWHTYGHRLSQTRRSCFTAVSGLDRIVTRIESLSLVTKEAASRDRRGKRSSLRGERAPAVLPRRRGWSQRPSMRPDFKCSGPAVSVLKDISLDQFGAPLLTSRTRARSRTFPPDRRRSGSSG